MSDASIVITTKDRFEDLQLAVESALAQVGRFEILVIDDGSTDCTPAIQARYPQIRYIRSEKNLGLVEQRNRAGHLASSPVIVSLDDDAVFQDPHTVAMALDELDSPSTAVLAMPYIDADVGILQQNRPSEGNWATGLFVGTAYAIKRQAFLDVGGYRGFFFRQGEERDLCLRLLDVGLLIKLGSTPPILHKRSPLNRDHAHIAYYGRRNDLLYTALTLPTKAWPRASLSLAHRFWQDTLAGYPKASAAGLASGVRQGFTLSHLRRPVSRGTYLLHRRLSRGPIPFEEALEALTAEKGQRLQSSDVT